MAQFYFHVADRAKAQPFLSQWLKRQPKDPLKPDWFDEFLCLTVPPNSKQVMADLWDPETKHRFSSQGLDPLYVNYPYVAAYVKKQPLQSKPQLLMQAYLPPNTSNSR